MPKNPTIYKSKVEATDAFIKDVQCHRNLIRKAFNLYGKQFCELLDADFQDVENRITNHDLSKYMEEVEQKGIIAYFYRYPEDGLSLSSNRRKYLFEKAMLNHYHLNSSHPEYWVQYKSGNQLTALPMDSEAIIEMVLDWIAIGYEDGYDDAITYWNQNRNKKFMTDDTVSRVDTLMDSYKTMMVNEK